MDQMKIYTLLHPAKSYTSSLLDWEFERKKIASDIGFWYSLKLDEFNPFCFPPFT